MTAVRHTAVTQLTTFLMAFFLMSSIWGTGTLGGDLLTSEWIVGVVMGEDRKAYREVLYYVVCVMYLFGSSENNRPDESHHGAMWAYRYGIFLNGSYIQLGIRLKVVNNRL